ncbi:MAG: hypothetical protein Q9224_003984 [Gallowayella concinna]
MDSVPQVSGDFIPVIGPEDQSASGYESVDEEEASRQQVLWTNVMEEGTWQNPSLYVKVEVLMLCWAVSDMDTAGEMNDLKTVFEKDFGYHVTTQRLNAKQEKPLQVQLNVMVAKFVYDHGGPNTLFIVYYAGHGRPGKYLDHLELAGQTSPNDRRDIALRERNKVVWNKTEDLLRPAEADVLEIFDCCYAGTVIRGESRLLEYMAAAKDHGTTKVPGPESFTRALIYALKALVKEKNEGRFTTDELLRKIKTDAPHFPKEQTPILSDRANERPSGRIMLHPLRQKGTASGVVKEDSLLKGASGYVMTLHFQFGEKPPDNLLRTLGEKFNELFEHNTLQVHRIRWGGIRETTFSRATRILMRTRRGSSQSQRSTKILDTAPKSTASLGSINTGLLSPSAGGFDILDSAGAESCSPLTISFPETPYPQEHTTTNMKAELSSLEMEGEGNFEAVLNAKLTKVN